MTACRHHITNTFCGSLASGRCASVLHGELCGILVAALFARSSPSFVSLPIHSDHLNAINFFRLRVRDALLRPPPPHSWTSLPARALFRWILSVLRPFLSTSPPSLIHVRAHTGASDPASCANNFVDIGSPSFYSAASYTAPYVLYGQVHPVPTPLPVH